MVCNLLKVDERAILAPRLIGLTKDRIERLFKALVVDDTGHLVRNDELEPLHRVV